MNESMYSFILWVKLPDWFEEDNDLKYFKPLSEKCFMSFIAEPKEISMEYSNNDISNKFDIFHIKFKEFLDEPIAKTHFKWISYHSDEHIEYDIPEHHTGQLLYIIYNSVKEQIDFSVMYTEVFPTTVQSKNFDDKTIDITFKGKVNINKQIDEFAEKYLKDYFEYNGNYYIDN